MSTEELMDLIDAYAEVVYLVAREAAPGGKILDARADPDVAETRREIERRIAALARWYPRTSWGPPVSSSTKM